ncbi:MAG: hypothetical protein OEX03_03355 [Gammaproteobacteria bacterium]|nr:hypothetical protein [Gammaproteobacteria bacterium]
MRDVDEEIKELSLEILRYLQSHPHAADSVEGIAKWWIYRQRVTEMVNKVQLALDYMVDEGVIVNNRISNVVVYKCTNSEAHNIKTD